MNARQFSFTAMLLFLVLAAGCRQQAIMNNNTNTGELAENNNIINDSFGIVGQSNSDILEDIDPSKVRSEMVEYSPGVQGYLATPNTVGTYPAVIMIHEWWGLNDNIKKMADLLAQEGYVVLAVDLYKGKIANTSEDAGKFAGAVRSNPAPAVQNMNDAMSFLQTLPTVKNNKIASLGWCFGGGQSLALAVSGSELSGTVIYYGTPLISDESALSKIGWPVLGVFGDKDQAIPVQQVTAFNESLNQLGIEHEIYLYSGVGHAFANPSGANYAAVQTKDAWEKTLAFLDKNLK